MDSRRRFRRVSPAGPARQERPPRRPGPRDAARSIHNSLTDGLLNKARLAGALSHDAYFRMAPPDAPASLEFFVVDVWMDGSGMGELYQDPEYGRGFQELFGGQPTTSVWTHP